MQRRFLFAGLFLSLTLMSLFLLAIKYDLFWRLRWFDTPMHVLGGLTIGAFLLGLFGQRLKPRWYIVLALIAFFGWEIFEVFAKIPQAPGGYWIDTAHDLVNDCIGGGFIYALARDTVWRST